MARCLISFGANIGDPLQTIAWAADRLQAELSSPSSSFLLSRFFKTPPVGGPSGQPPFINAVAAIDTSYNVWEVWQTIRSLEQELGRTRNQRWEARAIDLDVLLFDDQRIWTPQFKVPHPRMCMRRFILLPAAEVASQWIDPVTQMSIGQLAANVMQGPSNLCLVSDSPAIQSTAMLKSVARQAMATWWSLENDADDLTVLNKQRWVTWQSFPSDGTGLRGILQTPSSKLTVWLTDPHSQPQNSAWEDCHLSAAQALNLVGPGESPMLRGPRYLLSGENLAWAQHELVAAMEAMDCPIEPIN
ncbi:MAG: 2-amino-4-hydroxy-6-hydroxymethyldihydropteridine diphosphokinase [Planctomycetales bacterium]|nr:2-amino-4-hydroxy-6-hydroxymethyldihydropteridine diphosphokinase [Planctomycetales bacterium]